MTDHQSYARLLRRSDLAGVYCQPDAKTEALTLAAEANGYLVFKLDLRKAKNKETLLDTIAHGMAFPEWFGHNYDALGDCLADLAWRPAEGYLVLLTHCGGLLQRAGQDFTTTLQVFQQAADEWRSKGQSLWCLVDGAAESIPRLPTDVGPE